MIEIARKEDCVGCEACIQRCPTDCIQIYKDSEGFIYPKVDVRRCIDCHVCEKVCPVIEKKPLNAAYKPVDVLAAKNPDDSERKRSSSGGVFIMLAKRVIADNGIVFGARFNTNWEVEHSYTDSEEGLSQFMGSKYLQSRIGNAFSDVERFLKEGRKVMFTGTPCQIAGLKLFLRKDYGDKLLTVDVICHGVPSPMVWADYLSSLGPDNNKRSNSEIKVDEYWENRVLSVSFRDKSVSWQTSGLRIKFKHPHGQSDKIPNDGSEDFFEKLNCNKYLRGFLSDTFLRPSCYECPVKNFKSESDITIGDYWGINSIHPEFADSDGVSVVICNTEYGSNIIKSLGMLLHKSDLNAAIRSNPALISSARRSKYTEWFWQNYKADRILALDKLIIKLKPKLYVRIGRKLKNMVRRLYNLITPKN